MNGQQPPLPKDEWVPRFSGKLRERVPLLSGDQAMSLAIAEATFLKAANVAPKEAVETISLRSRLRRSVIARQSVMCPDSQVEWLARFSCELRSLRPIFSLVAIRHKALAALDQDPTRLREEAAREYAQARTPSLTESSEVNSANSCEVIWVRVFAKRLFELQGAIRGRNSTAAARKSYRDARGLSPEEAAEIYATALPPHQPGEPGD